MKNFFRIVFIAILVLALFCGCSSSDEPAALPEETSEPKWECDPFEHWKIDETGEKTNIGTHETGEYGFCGICGSMITDRGSGNFGIDFYDENGNIAASKEHENGELFGKFEYTSDTEGNLVTTSSTIYNPDGIRIDTKYNENGDTSEERAYFPDGSLYFENTYEYAVSDDGTRYVKVYVCTDYVEELKFESVYDEYGDIITYTTYGLSGIMISTEETKYEYNSEGRKTYGKTTVYGRVKNEYFFDYYEDENGIQTYCCKEIYHNEMGGKTVFEYNENGEVLSETSFDPYGNEIE